MALGLVLPFILNPTEVFLLTVGYTLVIAVICVYVVANIAVVVYYWREARDEFNWLFHFIFPIGTSLVLIYSVYKAFYPLPAYPYNWSPFIVAGWLILGIVVVVWMGTRGNQDWLKKAGAIIDERVETADELAHQHPHAL
jgi:amino acid transporter